MAGLYLDRRVADRGYGYVGASRVRHKNDLYLMGRVRRTDWLPVGEDPAGGEPSILSEDDGSDERSDNDTDSRDGTSNSGVDSDSRDDEPDSDDNQEVHRTPHTQGSQTASVKIWNRVSTASISRLRTLSMMQGLRRVACLDQMKNKL